MTKIRTQGRSLKAQRKAAVRASITFPPDLYETLEEIAQQKKVSLAWVVRDASERYVEGETEQRGKRQRQTVQASSWKFT
jgi:metal-responsive CopG/Arc/MetJ family transcriptional regulator